MRTDQDDPERVAAPASMQHAIIVHPFRARRDEDVRTPAEKLEELRGLARAIGIEAVASVAVPLVTVRAATLLGSGKVAEIGTLRTQSPSLPGLVIINAPLSPVQHRNLEKTWDCKVLDRTALILEIFGARARTREGRLQVELAHMSYQKSRLVRSWTHLDRQRGGGGFLGGPGERQLETDRRQIEDRILRLKAELDEVRRTRHLQRAQRKKAPHPIVSLVGYTNAGKSTLFNRMTGADVLAKDLLFATLDTTMRAVDLPGAARVIMSDTVGFIADLPTDLIAAFRATLEEVLEADVILHVRDIAHPETEAQRNDVLSVLRSIGVEPAGDQRVIEVWNKIDLLAPDDAATMTLVAQHRSQKSEATLEDPAIVAVSAVSGENIAALYASIDAMVTADHGIYRVEVSRSDGAPLAWLHAHGEVIETAPQAETDWLTVRLSPKHAGQFSARFGLALHADHRTRRAHP